jgi:hypothetical protein
VQAVIGYQAAAITGNQRQADLGRPEGLAESFQDVLVPEVMEHPHPDRWGSGILGG